MNKTSLANSCLWLGLIPHIGVVKYILEFKKSLCWNFERHSENAEYAFRDEPSQLYIQLRSLFPAMDHWVLVGVVTHQSQ